MDDDIITYDDVQEAVKACSWKDLEEREENPALVPSTAMPLELRWLAALMVQLEHGATIRLLELDDNTRDSFLRWRGKWCHLRSIADMSERQRIVQTWPALITECDRRNDGE